MASLPWCGPFWTFQDTPARHPAAKVTTGGGPERKMHPSPVSFTIAEPNYGCLRSVSGDGRLGEKAVPTLQVETKIRGSVKTLAW